MMDSTSEYIYETSQSLKPAAIAWSKRFVSVDISFVEDILMDTVVYFIEKKLDISQIKYFPSYFFTSFKHRFYDVFGKSNDYRKTQNLRDLHESVEPNLRYNSQVHENIESSFLFEEALKNLDGKSRFILAQRILGLTYKEIVPKYNEAFNADIKENFLRSKLSKAISKILSQSPQKEKE